MSNGKKRKKVEKDIRTGEETNRLRCDFLLLFPCAGKSGRGGKGEDGGGRGRAQRCPLLPALRDREGRGGKKGGGRKIPSLSNERREGEKEREEKNLSLF